MSIEEVRNTKEMRTQLLGACYVIGWVPVPCRGGCLCTASLAITGDVRWNRSSAAQQPTALLHSSQQPSPPIRPTVRLAALLHPPPGRALVSFHFCSVSFHTVIQQMLRCTLVSSSCASGLATALCTHVKALLAAAHFHPTAPQGTQQLAGMHCAGRRSLPTGRRFACLQPPTLRRTADQCIHHTTA